MRIARYRGRAHVCNACRLKELCTDSNDGREVTRPLDPWPHSEVGRFHRGIALAMVGAGALIIAAGAALNHRGADLLVLGAALVLSIVVGLHLAADFRTTPSGFPVDGGGAGGREALGGLGSAAVGPRAVHQQADDRLLGALARPGIATGAQRAEHRGEHHPGDRV